MDLVDMTEGEGGDATVASNSDATDTGANARAPRDEARASSDRVKQTCFNTTINMLESLVDLLGSDSDLGSRVRCAVAPDS